MLVLEGRFSCRFLSLTHYLHLDPLGADIVEHQLGAGGTFGIYPSSNAAFHICFVLARLEAFIFLQEVSEVCVNLEFVGVGIGIFVLTEFLDLCASDLVVLLGPRISAQLLTVTCMPIA